MNIEYAERMIEHMERVYEFCKAMPDRTVKTARYFFEAGLVRAAIDEMRINMLLGAPPTATERMLIAILSDEETLTS